MGEERSKRLLEVFGFPNSFGADRWRNGCVYETDDEKFKKLVNATDMLLTAGGATSLSQIAAIAAMEETADWRTAFLEHITKNRDFAVAFINEHIPALHAYKPQATFLLYVDIQELKITGAEFVEFLKKEVKLAIVPGGHQYFGDESEGHVRICLATSMEILSEGLNRLQRGVEMLMERRIQHA